MPKHHKRLQLMRAKRRSEKKNSDYLYRLESLMSVAEFDTMIADEMVIHLFIECANKTMSRLVLDLLAGDRPAVAELRIKVKETENCIWYKSGNKYGKLSQREK